MGKFRFVPFHGHYCSLKGRAISNMIYGWGGGGCISLLAFMDASDNGLWRLLIGNIHSGNRAHRHHTHKTRRNTLLSSKHQLLHLDGYFQDRENEIFNIISLASLLGQGDGYFTPFFSPFPKERVRVRE